MKQRRRASSREKSAGHPHPVDALVYPRFSGIATFMRLPHIARADELDIALIGIPYDGGTTYRPGPPYGPRHVREQSAISRAWKPVLSRNPFEAQRLADFGDLSINPRSIEDTFQRITSQRKDFHGAG